MQDKEFKDKTATRMLKSLSSNDSLRTIYPVLSRFSQIALTLPVGKAERGFSCMNHVNKTELPQQAYCIIIGHFSLYLNGRTRNFNAAVLIWSTIRNRLIYFVLYLIMDCRQ